MFEAQRPVAATQAAGLKSNFGTMCKPLHAGKASYHGLMAAKLAARGAGLHPALGKDEQPESRRP